MFRCKFGYFKGRYRCVVSKSVIINVNYVLGFFKQCVVKIMFMMMNFYILSCKFGNWYFIKFGFIEIC